MSHHTEPVTCPNCGFDAAHNYCAQCGQEIHLHKDTLGALFMHFIGHYFHYDSKFWQSLKTLWFKPGKLTTAYWQKQRARYLSPVSLYIFISAVFFLCFFLVLKKTNAPQARTPAEIASDSVQTARIDSFKYEVLIKLNKKEKAIRILNRKHEQEIEVFDKIEPEVTKVFFFMIPVLAYILKLMFFRRRDLTIVHHTIFSLHVQAFFFCCFALAFLMPSVYVEKETPFTEMLDNLIAFAVIVIFFTYFIAAIKNAYQVKWGKAILYSLVIDVLYAIGFIIVAIVYMVIKVLLG